MRSFLGRAAAARLFTKEAMRPITKRERNLVDYHDHLAALIDQAEHLGEWDASRRLQLAAGRLAGEHEVVARTFRRRRRSGPGTYPFYECVQDQRRRGYTDGSARAICGRIRGNSRNRYRTYWQAREDAARERKRNPRRRKRNPSADFAIAINQTQVQDGSVLMIIYDAEGTVVNHHRFGKATEAIAAVDLVYSPDLPILGPVCA